MLHKLLLLLTVGAFSSAAFAGMDPSHELLDQDHVFVPPQTAGLTPSLFLSLPGGPNGQDELRQIINAYTAAIGFAKLVGDAHNGIGTEADDVQLTPEAFSTEGLRYLSSYDLHMIDSIRAYQKNFKTPATFKYVADYVPQEQVQDDVTAAIGKKITNPTVQSYFSKVAPIFSGNIRQVNPEVVDSEAFIKDARNSMAANINRNFRVYTPVFRDFQSLDKLQYMYGSYMPILTSGNTFIDTSANPKSVETHQFYFSIPGQLTTTDKNGKQLNPINWTIDPIDVDLVAQSPDKKGMQVGGMVTFDRMTLGDIKVDNNAPNSKNLNMMMIETDKNYANEGLMTMKVAFGKLDKDKKVDKQHTLAPFDYTDPTSGLMIRGRLDKPVPDNASSAKKDAIGILNYFLNKFQLRLTVNRIVMNMQHQQWDAKNNKWTESWEDVMDDQSPILPKDIKSDPAQTVMHFTMYWVTHHFDNTLGGKVWYYGEKVAIPATWYLDHFFFFTDELRGLTGVKCYQEAQKQNGAYVPDDVCSMEFDSLEAFNNAANSIESRILHFVGLDLAPKGLDWLVMKELQGQVGNSINGNIPGQLLSMDAAIAANVKAIMQQAAKAKQYLGQIVSSLPQNAASGALSNAAGAVQALGGGAGANGQ